jgi:class 3 adenylate cyclase
MSALGQKRTSENKLAGGVLPYTPQRSEGRVQAERRQVTVLFTDMVGFTSFSERAGEEAAYTLMRGLSKQCDSIELAASVHRDLRTGHTI